jgi:uracil phosphoribosyltransferase
MTAADAAYDVRSGQTDLEHHYGTRVTLLHAPAVMSLLTRIGHPDVVQPELGDLVRAAYQHLAMEAFNRLLPVARIEAPTRMIEHTERGVYRGSALAPDQKVVSVAIARAGIVPSELCFRFAAQLLGVRHVRQDHFAMARKTNAAGAVIGVAVSGEKIGGDVDAATVLLPDPMGATGGSIDHAIAHYKANVAGRAARYVALFLTVTPEAIERLLAAHDDVHIIALRLDRGFSSQAALAAAPGSVAGERGLTDTQYIVPGAGGVGEVLNNSFV